MRLRVVLVILILAAASQSVRASLVQTSPLLTSGSGIGGVNTVLTVQDTPSESGCIGWNGTADVVGPAACPAGITGGDEKTGSSLTQTRSLAELAITNASDLRIVLNSAEPGGDSITLVNLVLRIYDATTGAVLFTTSISGSITFPTTATGTGTSGYVFRMDATDALAAQPFFANPNNRVGLAVTLSNSAGGNETLYVVNAPAIQLCPEITISPLTLPNATVGAAYSQQLTASGGTGPYTFTLAAGALPAGITVSPTGLISGVPTTAGTSVFTVRATDANGCTRDQEYQLVVTAVGCPIITISPTTLPGATIGVAYSQQLTASGGTAPYSFTLASGALPTGISFSSAGLISGVPAAATGGTHTFTVRATDAASCTRDQPLQLIVAAAVPLMPLPMLVVLVLLLLAIATFVMNRAHAAR